MEHFYYALSSVLDPDPDSNPHKYATDVEGGACSLQSTHGCNSNWTRAAGDHLAGLVHVSRVNRITLEWAGRRG